MSTPTMTTATTTGVGAVGPYRTVFVAVHRETDPAPPVLDVSLSVPVSGEDITAVLWLVLIREQVTDLAEFTAHPAMVHDLVCETLLAQGGNRLARTRRRLADIRPEHPEHPRVTAVRALVGRLYGTPTTPTAPQSNANRQELDASGTEERS